MVYEFEGNAMFTVAGTVDIPEGTPEELLATDAGKKAIWLAFQEWWENTGIKLRDAHVAVTGYGEFRQDGEQDENYVTLDEVVEV